VGDFGVGWSLGISNVRVEKTHGSGKHWTQTATGGWFPSYCLEPTEALQALDVPAVIGDEQLEPHTGANA
jgi:hypothetical protein